jgi:hypothetical protein
MKIGKNELLSTPYAGPRFVTIQRAAELTGYTPKAIEIKRYRGVWVEGQQIRVAPDGRVFVDMDAFERWVVSNG